jgi:hypothetical protein
MTTLVAVLFLAFPMAADEIELENGRVLEGKVEDLGDSIRLTRSGASVTYPRHMVVRIEYRKTPEEAYAERAREIRDGDLEGRLKLARWCLEKKLAAEARIEFQKVVAVNPDHEEARAALGHRLHQGQWMTEDQINEARGLVKHKGRWMTPEERDLEAALEEQKELDQKLIREVRVQLDRLRSSDPKKREEAREALEKIDDKFKLKPYLAALSYRETGLRGHVIAELGRMKAAEAARPLARRVVWDDEVPFRDLALRSLQEIGHPDTALFLAVYLAEESVSARIRCEEAIGRFRDPRVVPALVEALENAIETSRALEQYGEQVTTMVNRTMVLRDGSRIVLPQVVRVRAEGFDRQSLEKLRQEKSAVLSTLGAITGQSFGEEPGRWREWMRKPK